jgi:hypothetical protein
MLAPGTLEYIPELQLEEEESSPKNKFTSIDPISSSILAGSRNKKRDSQSRMAREGQRVLSTHSRGSIKKKKENYARLESINETPVSSTGLISSGSRSQQKEASRTSISDTAGSFKINSKVMRDILESELSSG